MENPFVVWLTICVYGSMVKSRHQYTRTGNSPIFQASSSIDYKPIVLISRNNRQTLGHRERGTITITGHRTEVKKFMAYLIVQHTVADYAKWKTVFDEHGATRKSRGSKGAQILRGADNPNELCVVIEWDSVQNAQSFSESDTLREAMERAGITSSPEILYFNGSETSNS
jgi:heme-degrading monooxygenase HmoA